MSAPSVGGQNGLGAFVSIYGRGFGNSPGTVSIGGGNAAAYPIWTDTKITLQLGSAAASGNIVLTTSAGQTSNGIPFQVYNGGTIYFVSVSGSDSNLGTFAQPWRTILQARNSMQPGDVTYAMNGVTQSTDDGQGWNAALTLRPAACPATGSTDPTALAVPASHPLALVAYPGALVTIGTTGTLPAFGLRSTDFTASGGSCGGSWVFAGLQFRGLAPVQVAGPSTDWRFVGNDISNPQSPGGGGGGAAWESSLANHVKFLGNIVHNTGGGTDRLAQAVYPSTDSNYTELGWNTIQFTQGRAGIQIHSSPLVPGTGFAMHHISIHDNIVHDTAGEGIIIDTVDPSQGPVEVYNNIVWNTGSRQGGFAIYGASSSDFDQSHGVGSGNVEIFNNTIYAWYGGAGFGSYFETHQGQLLVYRLRNNLLRSTGPTYWVPFTSGEPAAGWRQCTNADTAATCPNFTGSNNLVFGAGPETYPNLLANEVNGDPLVLNATGFDFHLQPTSPAASSGTTVSLAPNTVSSIVQSMDFDGTPLPPFPIGAYTLSASPVASPVAVPVINVNIAAHGQVSPGVEYVDLQFRNAGTVGIWTTFVTQLQVSTLVGFGASTVDASSPPLPLSVGALVPGAAGTVRVYLDVPSTVRALRIAGTAMVQGANGLFYNAALGIIFFP